MSPFVSGDSTKEITNVDSQIYKNIQNINNVRPPDLPFWVFWKFLKTPKMYFDVFGRFSKLISISISAVGCA